MRTSSTITMAEGQLLAQRAVDLAEAAGTPVAVCIMDTHYRPVATLAMDGVALEFIEIAAQKADSALRIGAGTDTMTEHDWTPRDHVVMAARGRAVFKGGILIDDDHGNIICALGISALSEDDDLAIAEAVEAAVNTKGGQLTLDPLPGTTLQAADSFTGGSNPPTGGHRGIIPPQPWSPGPAGSSHTMGPDGPGNFHVT